MNTEGNALIFVSINVLPRSEVRVSILKSSQAKIAPARAAKSPTETKLTVLDRAPPKLPEELPGLVVAGRGDVVVVERGVGGFVVGVRGVVVVVLGRVAVELVELVSGSEEVERGRVVVVFVEFEQVVAGGRWV